MQELCLYVAVDGCDRWSGRLSKPNATGNDGPLATLTRARDAASLIKRTHRGPIKILILAGTHYLAEPLVLGPEDSGSADGTITYAAMPAEQATLSGGRRLEVSWQPYRDGIMMGSPQGQGPLDFSQLFVNGRRQIRARYPNYDSANPLVGGGGWVTAAPRGNLPGLPVHYELGSRSWIREVEAAFVPHTEFDFDPATFTKKRWSRPDEAVVHAMTSHPHLTSCGWGSIHYQVKDVDWTNHRIRLGKGGWQMSEVCTGPPTINESSRFYVENVFEELDAPGEWYFDRRQQVLYYYPPKGLDLSAARVETDGIKHLVELRGRKDLPVHHVRLEGLRLAHSAVTYLDPYETPSLGDWSIYRGGAIVLEGTEDCEVRNCFFDALGGNGVFLNCYNRRAEVCGNKFVELGDSAVCLVGRSHLRNDLNYTCPFCGQEHCWNWDTPSEETPGDCRVSNNLIHHVGVFGKQTAGVFVSLAYKITISHNHIHHVPRAAVCINDGLWGGHVIEFNDIHDTVLETGDHGPFNSWGREPFWCARQSHGPSSHPAGDVIRYARHTTVIRYNRFRDNRGWGIDLDDGSSNYHVHGNLCVGISIKLREGDLRLVENNIFINPANPACMHVGYENNSDRFLRNIIVTNTASENPERDVNFNPQASEGAVIQMAGVPSQGPLLKESDYNLFYTDVGHAFINILQRDGVRHRYSLDQWRRLGFDRHSAYGDPAFVAPEQGDYRVRPDSPAIGLGFQNFPMDRFGLLENFPAQWR